MPANLHLHFLGEYTLFGLAVHLPQISFCFGLLFAFFFFFLFLRVGEFTCSSQAALSSDMLIVDDIFIDSHEDPSHIMICLKLSKTDLKGAGLTLHLVAQAKSFALFQRC